MEYCYRLITLNTLAYLGANNLAGSPDGEDRLGRTALFAIAHRRVATESARHMVAQAEAFGVHDQRRDRAQVRRRGWPCPMSAACSPRLGAVEKEPFRAQGPHR